MTVYTDVVFFMNFIYDLGLLLIILRLNSKKIPPLRLFLSACLGGIQGVCAFVPYFRILAVPPIGLFLPFLLSFLVLYPSKATACIKGGILFLASAFLLSGAMSFFGFGAAWGLFLLALVYFLIWVLKNTALRKNAKVRLYYGGKSVELTGFLDSGNSLFYNGTPVILASSEVFCRLFGSGFSIYAIEEWVPYEAVCIIPYSTLGKTGTVIGVRLEGAVVAKKSYDDIILGYFSDNFSEDLILNGIMV